MDLLTIYILVPLIAVFGLQYYFGYKEYKALGFVFPIAFIGLVIFFVLEGVLEFSIRDVLMPFLGLFTLAGIWESGHDKKQKAVQKELDKMKARDQQRI